MKKSNLNTNKIHKRFKELRESTETNENKALPQRQLAKLLGIAHSEISNLECENDDKLPTLTDLIAYRDYFNVSIDYLLGLEDTPTTDPKQKLIYNEYGISHKALNNLKKSIVKYDFDKRLSNSLNLLLESNNIGLFLDALSKYIYYYPFHSMQTYILNMDKEEYLKTLDKQSEFVFHFALNKFGYEDNKEVLDSKTFENILLDKIKNELIDIKKQTNIYINNCKKDLKKLENELITLETANELFGSYNEEDFKNYQYKITKLKFEIENLKKKIL